MYDSITESCDVTNTNTKFCSSYSHYRNFEEFFIFIL